MTSIETPFKSRSRYYAHSPTSSPGAQPFDIDQYDNAADRIGRILQKLSIAAKTMRDVAHHREDLRAYLGRVAAVPGSEADE